MLPPTHGRGPAPIEHTVVGTHRFPLFSHPVFRVKLAEEQYVTAHVSAALENPELYAMIDAYVEQMLAHGKESVTEADVDALLHATVDTPQARPPEPHREPVHGYSSSIPRSCAENARTTEHAPREATHFAYKNSKFRPTETRTHRLVPIAVDALDKTQAHPRRTHPNDAYKSATHHSKRLPDPLEPAVVSAAMVRSEDSDPYAFQAPSTTASRSQKLATEGGSSMNVMARPMQGPTPTAKQLVRVAVYSVLQQKLNADGAVPRMADIDRYRAALEALDSQQLHRLPQDAYAALDVGMDGNSSCLRRRQKPTDITPMQLTSVLLAAGQLSSQATHSNALAYTSDRQSHMGAAPSLSTSSGTSRTFGSSAAAKVYRRNAARHAENQRSAEVNRRGRQIADSMAAAASTKLGTQPRQPLSRQAPPRGRHGGGMEPESRLTPSFPEDDFTNVTRISTRIASLDRCDASPREGPWSAPRPPVVPRSMDGPREGNAAGPGWSGSSETVNAAPRGFLTSLACTMPPGRVAGEASWGETSGQCGGGKRMMQVSQQTAMERALAAVRGSAL